MLAPRAGLAALTAWLTLVLWPAVALGAPAPANPSLPPGIRPILGVQTSNAPAGSEGLEVDAVMPNTPAARMGVREGDRLLTLNGVPMHDVGDIRAVLQGLRRGDRLKARLTRGGQALERETTLDDVPVLPSYEVEEGVGIPGVVRIGDTRQQVEKVLGPAPGEMQREAGILYLGYPRLGLTMALMPGPKELRVVLLRVEYPFVGRTRRGVVTLAPRATMLAVYARSGMERYTTTNPNGAVIDSFPSQGVRFVSRDETLVEVHVLPLTHAPAQRP